MRGQSETFIYHWGCVEVKPIPAELKDGKRAGEGQETLLKELSEEVYEQLCVRACVCVFTVEGQV